MAHSRFGSALSLSLALALAGTVGCTHELKLMGETCQTSDDCNSNLCGSKGVCTKNCDAQTDCPNGFDCTLPSAEATQRTCNKPTYPVVESGGFGVGCTAETCTGAASPCNTDQGFFCYALDGNKCSAVAACTHTCDTDADCPYNYFCGENTLVDSTGKRVTTKACFERTRCTDCRFDDECPASYRCAEDNIGGHFCGKTCNSDDDCRNPTKSFGGFMYGPFETCQDGTCTPVTGACHGKSPVPAVEGDNNLCAPCRVGVPGDCGPGMGCFELYSGERFCATNCTAPLQMQNGQWAQTGKGDCKYGLTCLAQAGSDCTGKTSCTGSGICTADSAARGYTCYPTPK